jgi:hypothetical protein
MPTTEKETAAASFLSILQEHTPRLAATVYTQQHTGDFKETAEDLAVLVDRAAGGTTPDLVHSSPLSRARQKEIAENGGRVDEVIAVRLGEIAGCSSFSELLSQKLCGHGNLEVAGFELVGASDEEVHVRVTGWLPGSNSQSLGL